MTKSTKNRFVRLLFENVRMVFLLFLFLVVFGTAAFANLERQGFPEVSINIALVTAPYPNASASQIEDELMKPIETTLADQDAVTEYETISNDNVGIAVVTFDESEDLDAAVAALGDDIDALDFPEDALDVDISTFTASGTGTFLIGVSGPEDVWDLYETAESIRAEFEDIDGIQSVSVTNGLTPEIVITFDEEAFAEQGMTRDQVEGLISASQLSLPVGTVVSEGGTQTLVTLEKDIESLEELRQLSIGDDLVLSDVAEVVSHLNNNDNYNRIGFRDEAEDPMTIDRALILAVNLDDDADILTVDDLLQEAMVEIEEGDDYEGVDVTVLYSEADSTREQIQEITSSVFGQNIDSLGAAGVIGYLFGGVTLVLILLFLFMNARVAILAALAIPLSLISASMYLALLGVGLNTLVLFSMVLAIGLVVDPTIVFLESLQRYREQGLSKLDAASKTMNTVGWGVTLAVLTNMLVFVPFGIVSGFFGEIIAYIPVTIIPAMLASLLIPVLFFTPFASGFLKPSKRKKKAAHKIGGHEVSWWLGRKLGGLIQALVKRGKARGVVRVVTVLLGGALPFLIAGGFIQSGLVEPVQFSEPGDVEFVMVYGDINDNWTFEKAVYDVIVPMQDVLAGYEEIENFAYFEQSGNDFTILLTLLDFDIRKKEEMRTGAEVAADFNEDIKKLNLDAEIEADTSGEGPPEDRFPVKVRLFDDDLTLLTDATEDVVAFMQGIEGVTRVQSNLLSENDEGRVTFTLDNGQEITQNPFLIYGLMNEPLNDRDLGTLTFDGEEFEVISRTDETVDSVEALKDIELPELAPPQIIPTLPGDFAVAGAADSTEEPTDPLTVGDVIASEDVSESTTIRRINGKRYVEISAMVDEDTDVFAVQDEIDTYLNEEKLVALGLDEDATSFKGEADSISQSFTELFIALAIAIFLIYVLLVGFFRSFLEPFIILFAIPLGLIGVFVAVAISTGQLGFLELLGVVAMAGIVVNVTILLIDFANQLVRDEGKTAEEAIATSVAVRFRPIVLTQLTAFGSLMPLVFYSPFWQGLASSIVFGIISSALLSLFITPILYVWSHKIETWPEKIRGFIGKRRSRTQTEYQAPLEVK